MDTTLYISFLIVSIGLIIIPGPNVLLIVATSISHGKHRGLQTVAGTTVAMAVQLFIAAIGTAWFVHLLAEGFVVLKWLGVMYLLYLGISHLQRSFHCGKNTIELSASSTFLRGFWVSLVNPKTIVFFSAFLPQFVFSTNGYIEQIAILSVTFLILAAILDSCYALISARLQPLLERGNLARMQNAFSCCLYLGASAWLALTRRS